MDPILAVVYAVDDILTRYIAIHNDIRKPTLRRAIPIPGIFKPIDFGSHTGPLEKLCSELEKCQQQIPDLKSSRPKNSQFLSVLDEYVEALGISISLLNTVAFNLATKSAGKNYSRKEYELDLETYDNSVYDYLEIGRSLNSLMGETIIGRGPAPWTVHR